MAKKSKRIYEYAKDLGISSAELMHKLKFMGIRVANTFNAVDDDTIEEIKRQMGIHLFEESVPVMPMKKKKVEEDIPARTEPAKTPPPPPAAPRPERTDAERPAPPKQNPPRPPAPAGARPQHISERGPVAPRPPSQRPPSSPSSGGRPPQGQPNRGSAPSGGRPSSPSGARPYTPSGGRPSSPSGGRPSSPSGGRPYTPSGGRPSSPSGGRPSSPSGGRPSSPSGRPPDKDRKSFPPRDGQKPRKSKTDEDFVPDPLLSAKPVGKHGKGKKESPDKKKKSDDYSSPSKRLEAIKKKNLQQLDRKGQKTTFLKKRSKKDKQKDGEKGAETPVEVKKSIRVSGPMTVKELSHEMGIKSSDVIMYLMKDLKLMTTLNQSLDLDVISLVCEYYGCQVEKVAPEVKVDGVEEIILPTDGVDDPSNMIERPPVVTVMGHVDHGKTRLLDTIRKTNVIDTEHGGITQHIGAYQAEHNGKKITFLDTPGHAAFTQLRARGAKVTDLAVLVVAADDGVMPQTIEAIDHAKEAKVPILVALNKMDKPDAKPDRVRQQLSDKGLIPEEWGGNTVFVEISAKFNKNIEDLLEMVFLVTDMKELKANPRRKAIGTVIEAKLDKGKGPVASVLVQNGTLRIGDHVVVGETYGRVRAMENDRMERLEEAGPSMPVEIIGLNAVPEAGDQLIVLEDEKLTKEIASKRRTKNREDKLRYESRISLEDLFNRIREEKLREFKVVLKADVQGSLEAITSALATITHEQVRVNVIRGGVGEIKETDIMLAAASNAVVMGYNVNILPNAQALATSEKVEVLFYEIIYQLTDEVRRAMAGLLAPVFEREYTGKAEIRAVFASSKVGSIGGSYVTEGEIFSNSVVVVKREGKEVYEGKMGSLKRFKDNVKSVKQGFECGIVLDSFPTLKEGDIVEAFRLKEKKRETI